MTDNVPFNDLRRASPHLLADVEVASNRVIRSGWYVLGPEHDAFERELALYTGTVNAVGLGNGTDALQLALAAVGVGPGDRVLTVANAGGYTTIATRLLGASPLYADVDPVSLQLTVGDAATAVDRAGPATAMVITHLFGAVGDVERLVAFARDRGMAVVEDCAQALGARIGEQMAGTFGDIATTSFYPTKNLGAVGDGGAVFTDRDDLAGAVRRMRQYGWSAKYTIETDHGMNSRLDELQAAVLRVKLPLLDGWNARRREIHARYAAAAGPATRVVSAPGPSFTAHLAVIETPNRDAARARFSEAGIGTDVHYPVPDHRQPLVSDPVSLPATEHAAERILSLPMFPELSDEEIERVCAVLEELQ